MAQEFRDGIRKAKAQLERNLARDAKNNKKGFCRYIRQQRNCTLCKKHHKEPGYR